MGILKTILRKRSIARRLPSGAITVNRHGEVLSSTVSSDYPLPLLNEIGREVTSLFQEARLAQMPLVEVSLHYASLRVTGRELRGGAVIFLSPLTAPPPAPA